MRNTKKTIISLIIVILLAFGISNLATYYLIASIPIEGSSMEPTIHHSDRAIVYRRANLEYGDIVIFFSEHDNKHLVKRIIGFEGDIIEIKQEGNVNYVFRNNQKIDEPYIKENMDYTQGQIVVGAGEFYYLGDNRNNSLDSHYGYLGDLDQVVGKVFLRINVKEFEFEFLI